jgi:CelD/BcsL family acetyltransferase involved in cellulose biosynthesis
MSAQMAAKRAMSSAPTVGSLGNAFIASNGFKVVEICDLHAIRALAATWQALARKSEPNPFYEPWRLIPAVREFGADQQLHFLFIFPRDSAEACGFFPMVEKAGSPPLRLPTLSLWEDKYCFLCAPFIGPNEESDTLKAVVEWFSKRLPDFAILELNTITAQLERRLGNALESYGWSHSVMKRFQRAELRMDDSGADYVTRAISTGRRKELRRLRNRLAENGSLECRELIEANDLKGWTDDFLDLEARGWKGQSGTAMKNNAASKRFFKEVTAEAMTHGRLMMIGLFLTGKPIAMKCNFLVPGGAYAFKIAYDEEYSRYSPGVQLEIENIRIARERGIRWMDSCAAPNHTMIDALWADRLEICTVLASPPRSANRLHFELLRLAGWSRSHLRKLRKAS